MTHDSTMCTSDELEEIAGIMTAASIRWASQIAMRESQVTDAKATLRLCEIYRAVAERELARRDKAAKRRKGGIK